MGTTHESAAKDASDPSRGLKLDWICTGSARSQAWHRPQLASTSAALALSRNISLYPEATSVEGNGFSDAFSADFCAQSPAGAISESSLAS